jgi:hypothetical protein
MKIYVVNTTHTPLKYGFQQQMVDGDRVGNLSSAKKSESKALRKVSHTDPQEAIKEFYNENHKDIFVFRRKTKSGTPHESLGNLNLWPPHDHPIRQHSYFPQWSEKIKMESNKRPADSSIDELLARVKKKNKTVEDQLDNECANNERLSAENERLSAENDRLNKVVGKPSPCCVCLEPFNKLDIVSCSVDKHHVICVDCLNSALAHPFALTKVDDHICEINCLCDPACPGFLTDLTKLKNHSTLRKIEVEKQLLLSKSLISRTDEEIVFSLLEKDLVDASTCGCPKCHTAYEFSGGCLALKCGNPNCGAIFCGLCHDCVEDNHPLVINAVDKYAAKSIASHTHVNHCIRAHAGLISTEYLANGDEPIEHIKTAGFYGYSDELGQLSPTFLEDVTELRINSNINRVLSSPIAFAARCFPGYATFLVGLRAKGLRV